jgi:small subunit ribosomal protein S16
VGTYDPMPNAFNQKMVSFNYERIRFWIGKGAFISDPVAELLGLAGFLPIHPRSYMAAWRARAEERKNAEKNETETAEKSN